MTKPQRSADASFGEFDDGMPMQDEGCRRALVAHEQSHLDHHHHLYAVLVRMAAAANPLIRDLVSAVDHASERWADTDAADVVGDPATVAHALGRAALAKNQAPKNALAASRSDVVKRVRELVEPRPTAGRVHAAIAVG